MLQSYVSIVSHGFNILQQVLLPMHSDSRAHTRCTARTHPTLSISVMRISSNSWTCTQRAITAQMVESSLVKVHAYLQGARAS
jgi:hypothetical protein